MENKSGLTPQGDLVLLLCPPLVTTTAGGLVIPEEAAEQQRRATRIAYLLDAGSVARANPRLENLEPGDMVVIPRYAADFVPVDGEMYLLIRADAVLAKADRMPDYQFEKVATSTAKVFGVNDVTQETPRIARLS